MSRAGRGKGLDLNALPKGTKITRIEIEAAEEPRDRELRRRKDLISFIVKDMLAYGLALLFAFVMGGYCCYVIARYGVTSAEARQVSPFLASLFGAVVGMAFSKATK